MKNAAVKINEMTGANVLVKGGHLEDTADDLLYGDGKFYVFPGERIDNPNTHGTGCTLSSAFASMLAKGLPLPEAAAAAKNYINDAIVAGAEYEIGHGFGPVKHFWALWKQD